MTYRVVGGSSNRTVETVNHHVSDVLRIVHHDEANHFTHKHDIALVTVVFQLIWEIIIICKQNFCFFQLTTPVPKYKQFYAPIPLADKVPDVGSKCTLAGWGSKFAPDENFKYNYTDEAMIGKVTVSDFDIGTKLINLLPEGSICYTWDGSGGVCNGDEGGPLIHEGRLVGILAPIKDCKYNNFTGFAVDIYQHLHWINENMYKTIDIHSHAVMAVFLLDYFLIFTGLLAIPQITCDLIFTFIFDIE